MHNVCADFLSLVRVCRPAELCQVGPAHVQVFKAAMSDANRGEAARCLDIARAAAAALDLAKAERFAEKAMRLFPSDEVLARIANYFYITSAAGQCRAH